MSNIIFHSVSNKINDSFVGIKVDGNDIHLYHPQCYSINKDSLKEDIINLIQTISIANTFSNDRSNIFNKKNIGSEFALNSYIWIIRDYLKNGLYQNKEKVYKINRSGRINWKKTIEQDPIISNKEIVYKDLIVEIKDNKENLLVEIYKFCLNKSVDYIGWLFGINAIHFDVPIFNATRKKLYIHVLMDELYQTFNDDKKSRLQQMLNIITGLDESSNNKSYIYGVDNYYYIYERMIDCIFNNVSSISDFYPKGKWQLIKYHYCEKDSSSLRPDTVMIKDDKAFILDAKYYAFGYTCDLNDLPETSSIQKQITYGEYVLNNSKLNFSKIYNAFLIPYDKDYENEFKSNEIIQYIGFAKSDWKNNEKNYEFIHTFLIDLKHVIKTWNSRIHKNDVSKLISDIEKYDLIALELNH